MIVNERPSRRSYTVGPRCRVVVELSQSAADDPRPVATTTYTLLLQGPIEAAYLNQCVC